MTIFIGGKVRNLTVKFWKYCFSVMVYMRKLESTVGLLGLLVLFFTATTYADEEYYTWIDENGVVNYAERNPQGFDARFVTSGQRFGYQGDEPAERNAPAQAEAQQAAAIAADKDRDIDVEIATERTRIDQEIATAKKSNCNIGKLNLAQLENYNRVKVQGDDGQVKVLSGEEKQARIDRAKTTIRENCN
jgi:hypothetical protein